MSNGLGFLQTHFINWLQNRSKFWTVIAIPLALAALSLAILLFWREVEAPWGYIMLGAWCAIFIVAQLTNTSNADAIKLGSLNSRIGATSLLNIDKYFESKLQILKARRPEIDSMPSLLEISREHKIFNEFAGLITDNLLDTLRVYLKRAGRLGTSSLVVTLLAPDKDGQCFVVGESKRTKGAARNLIGRTNLNIEDGKYLGSELWRDGTDSIRSTRDTKKVKFHFHEGEKTAIKSIFLFRINDPVQGKPIAIWSIEANKIGVFPDRDEQYDTDTITFIVQSFERILTYEYTNFIMTNKL